MAGARVERAEAATGDDFIAFHASGERVVGEFHCSECGYGIVSRGLLPSCPMCRSASWEKSPWRPFTRQVGRT